MGQLIAVAASFPPVLCQSQMLLIDLAFEKLNYRQAGLNVKGPRFKLPSVVYYMCAALTGWCGTILLSARPSSTPVSGRFFHIAELPLLSYRFYLEPVALFLVWNCQTSKRLRQVALPVVAPV